MSLKHNFYFDSKLLDSLSETEMQLADFWQVILKNVKPQIRRFTKAF